MESNENINTETQEINELSLEDQVKKVINKIRPYIQRDGGDCQFVRITDDGYVVVSMYGACQGCMSLDETLKFGIEALLMEEVNGIKGVKLDTELYK